MYKKEHWKFYKPHSVPESVFSDASYVCPQIQPWQLRGNLTLPYRFFEWWTRAYQLANDYMPSLIPHLEAFDDSILKEKTYDVPTSVHIGADFYCLALVSGGLVSFVEGNNIAADAICVLLYRVHTGVASSRGSVGN